MLFESVISDKYSIWNFLISFGPNIISLLLKGKSSRAILAFLAIPIKVRLIFSSLLFLFFKT